MTTNEQLFIAAQIGAITDVRTFLKQGADVDFVDSIGATSIYIAAQNGHAEIVELLLKKGADPEFKLTNSMNALCAAAHNGHIKAVQFLLDYGADIESTSSSRATPLYIAALLSDIDMMLLLLSKGANRNIAINEISFDMLLDKSLFHAALNGNVILVDKLIQAGANKNYIVDAHSTLYAAIYNSHKDVVELLLEAGAKIEDNENHFTSMFLAASKGLNKKAVAIDKEIYALIQEYYFKDVAKFHQESVSTNRNMEIVVARFNEDVSWLKVEFPDNNVTIFNKGDALVDIPSNWKIVNIPNVGLDPFAYLTYIINNYHHLADRILFLQGTPYDHPVYLPLGLYQRDIAQTCTNIIGKCQNTSLKAEWEAISHTLATKEWETYDSGKYSNVVMQDYDFLQFMNKYICPYPLETKFHINWGTEFAVEAQNILRHPIEYYQAILETLNDIPFPIEVHYLERLFDLVFQDCHYGD